MRNFLLPIVVSALAGCGGWSRPNTTEAQFYQDRSQCEYQAATAYPVVMSSTGGYQGPAQTRCTTYGGVTNCTTTPGTSFPGVQTDMNVGARAGAFNSCMRGRGYTFGS